MFHSTDKWQIHQRNLQLATEIVHGLQHTEGLDENKIRFELRAVYGLQYPEVCQVIEILKNSKAVQIVTEHGSDKYFRFPRYARPDYPYSDISSRFKIYEGN